MISPGRLIPEEYVYYAHCLEECVVPAVKFPVWANTTTRWGANYFAALEEQWLQEWNIIIDDIPKRLRSISTQTDPGCFSRRPGNTASRCDLWKPWRAYGKNWTSCTKKTTRIVNFYQFCNSCSIYCIPKM